MLDNKRRSWCYLKPISSSVPYGQAYVNRRDIERSLKFSIASKIISEDYDQFNIVYSIDHYNEENNTLLLSTHSLDLFNQNIIRSNITTPLENYIFTLPGKDFTYRITMKIHLKKRVSRVSRIRLLDIFIREFETELSKKHNEDYLSFFLFGRARRIYSKVLRNYQLPILRVQFLKIKRL